MNTQQLASKAKADETVRGYAHDLASYETWCTANGRTAYPADGQTIADYLTSMNAAGKAVATIARALSSIAVGHRRQGFDSPRREQVVRDVMAGIGRTRGTHNPAQKAPLVAVELKAAVEGASLRDRAVLLLTYAAALRRSEAADLTVSDLAIGPRGVAVRIRRSKTDQEGRGETIAVCRGTDPATCPVAALEAWLAASGRTGEDTVFGIGDKQIARLVKAAAARLGLDPSNYAGHSLRAGFVTQAMTAGCTHGQIARVTRHKDLEVLNRYARFADPFAANAAAGAAGL